MKKTVRFIFIIIFLVTTENIHAQETWINTDRPDQSDGTYTIPVHSFQIENGPTVAKNTFMNNFLIRYGLAKTTELRLLVDAGNEQGLNGMKPVTLSLKQGLFKQKGALPDIAFVGYVAYGKLATKDFQSPDVPFVLKLAFENDLSEKFSLGYNIGTSNQFKNLDLTFEGAYTIKEGTSVYLEYFSSFNKDLSDQNIDAGILYAVKPNFQLDFATGFSLSEPGNPTFFTFGISYLFMKQ